MEISIVGQKGLKIRTKNASFIVNPEKKTDEEVIVLTKVPQDYSEYEGKIVFSGPGEYEAAGVSIKAESQADGTSFDFFEEGQRLVVLPSPKIPENRDTEDANAIVTYVDESSTDNISKLTGDLVAVIGPVGSLPSDSSNIKKTDRINLKKTEEYKGYLVHLSK
jgi:hypothetical protein